jgi:hypothetical protein
VYVYGLVWSCYESCSESYGLVWFGVEDWFTNRTVWCRVVSRVGRFVWCRVDRFGSVRFGLVESCRVLDRFGIRAERYAERLRIATRIAFTK